MARQIQIILEKRGVTCTAELLDDLAPKTCQALWNALPQGGDAYHAKYANNEVYTLVPPFADEEPGLENPTMMPTSGDLLYFFFSGTQISQSAFNEKSGASDAVDLAIFYGRDNYLLSPTLGPVPGNRFGTVTENFEAMAKACDNIWREGFKGERLVFTRKE